MYERKNDKFVFLELEGNQIMLEEINANWYTGELSYPFGRGINISMSISDITNYYQILKDKKINFFKELMVNKYRVNDEVFVDQEFLVQDPDGYLLRFNN